jgi:hypothetical protein
MQMKKNIINWVLLLTLISCTKEQGVPGVAGSQGPAGANGKGSSTDTASITGNTTLYSEFNQKTDPSGVIVTLVAGSQQHTDTTDANGNFVFPGMATGTYDLTFQKTGYGTMKSFGLSHFAGGTSPTRAGTFDLLQMPAKTAPRTLSVASNNFNTTTFSLQLDTSSLTYVELEADIMVCIAKGRVATPYDYDFIVNPYAFPDGSGGYSPTFNKFDQTTTAHIVTGDSLYAVAYTYNRNIGTATGSSQSWSDLGLASYYMDPTTGKYVYPNLSKPSNVVKFAY